MNHNQIVVISASETQEYNQQNEQFKSLLGEVVQDIHTVNDMFFILFANGKVIKLYHYTCCCESVWIEDIVGDMNRLIGQSLTLAEGIGNRENESMNECDIWHYYKFGTVRETITIRFMGYSNYYSEDADLEIYQIKLDDGEAWNSEMFKQLK